MWLISYCFNGVAFEEDGLFITTMFLFNSGYISYIYILFFERLLVIAFLLNSSSRDNLTYMVDFDNFPFCLFRCWSLMYGFKHQMVQLKQLNKKLPCFALWSIMRNNKALDLQKIILYAFLPGSALLCCVWFLIIAGFIKYQDAATRLMVENSLLKACI